MNTSLIIPAYNEEKRLPAYLEEIISYAKNHPKHISEVLVVDDGSTDKTAEIIKRYEPQVNLIQLPHNQGKGAAIRAGVQKARGDAIVFLDADGATPITEMPKMVEGLGHADIAVGNRWMNGAHVQKSTALRHLAGWIYMVYMSMFGLGGIDTMCGFKGYRADVAKKLFSNLIEKRWLFDTEIAYKAVRANYTVKNFPIEWESKEGSKLTTSTLIKSGFQIFPLIQKIRRQERSE